MVDQIKDPKFKMTGPRKSRGDYKIVQEYDKAHPIAKEERRPWYKKYGWVGYVGGVLITAGTTVAIGGEALVGGALAAVGSALGLFDFGGKSVKKKKGIDTQDNVTTALVAWVKATVKLVRLMLSQRKEK